jgi:PAS domain S-box-containing protein
MAMAATRPVTPLPRDVRLAILDASPDAMAVISREGRIAFLNPGAQAAFGMDGADNAPCESLWPRTERATIRMAFENALRGGQGRFQAPISTTLDPVANDPTRWWEVLISPIRDGTGEVEAVLAVSRDITDFKRMQDRLNAALAQARAESEARNQFIVHLGAEIRAGVANLLGFAGLMGRARNFEPDRRDYLQRISRVGAGLLCLLNDLLEGSRRTVKDPDARIGSMDVDRFMAAVVDLSAARAAAKWVIPSQGGDAESHIWLELDEQTRRILGIFKGAA